MIHVSVHLHDLGDGCARTRVYFSSRLDNADKTCLPASFILSGYGTNSSFTAIDV